MHNQYQKSDQCFYAAQSIARVLVTAATVAATWLIFTSKQTISIVGIGLDARYSYSPAFKFFAYANLAACALSALSTLAVIFGGKSVNPKKFFGLFVHDLILTTLLMAACAAATAVGYIGKYGDSHTGWIPICNNFAKFCNRVTISVAFSYLAVIFYLFLAITSANKSRQI